MRGNKNCWQVIDLISFCFDIDVDKDFKIDNVSESVIDVFVLCCYGL